MAEVLRYSAFTLGGEGGNPAGVVLDADDLDDAEMQRIAADVGYSETAFLRARDDEPNVYDVRYFAPEQEVPFCGHATIAAAVALAEREPAAEMIFHTPAGLVTVNTQESSAGVVAELTSVAPRVSEPPEGLVEACLEALHWAPEDLDPSYPPMLANAGAEHLILVVRSRERLLDLDYDFDALSSIMAEHGLVTCALIWPKSRKKYFARNPFPSGGVVEDPATGAAAAAFGGYLRELGKIGHTASFTIRQGAEIGRPSQIEVSVIEGEPGVRLRGLANQLDDEE
jgi:PhzF family phenazine biosynthesis protein